MGSVWTTDKSVSIKGAFGKVSNLPFYLQFVPGIVVDVVTSPTNIAAYGDYDNMNTIFAIPHISEGGIPKKKSNVTDSDRYIPLMRGFADVPTKGDPVLLCTIGGIQYYLGPLNTQNQVNFNPDNLFTPEKSFFKKDYENNVRKQEGGSLNFKKIKFQRLGKIMNEDLEEYQSYNEMHGDMMLEGRHGNSIRIGSRDVNPYIFISNGRTPMAMKESLGDGTLISITHKGSLSQHFGSYFRIIEDTKNEKEMTKTEQEEVPGFSLASDLVLPDEDPLNRLMGTMVSSVNNDQSSEEIIYDYGKDDFQDQILFHSNRITLNTKLDDMFLSSNKDIHIGTKRHLTISTNQNFIVESEKTYLGDPNKKTMDNMVLGKKLQDVLKDIVSLFKELKTPTMMGPQMPMPLPSEQKVMTAIDNILSNKHFLEE